MIVHGYVKGYMYGGDGTFWVKVRVPSIHGPYTQQGYQGNVVRNYTQDTDLPYYRSVLLPHLPTEGEVVALTSMNDKSTELFVIGLTGGSYVSGATDLYLS